MRRGPEAGVDLLRSSVARQGTVQACTANRGIEQQVLGAQHPKGASAARPEFKHRRHVCQNRGGYRAVQGTVRNAAVSVLLLCQNRQTQVLECITSNNHPLMGARKSAAKRQRQIRARFSATRRSSAVRFDASHQGITGIQQSGAFSKACHRSAVLTAQRPAGPGLRGRRENGA